MARLAVLLLAAAFVALTGTLAEGDESCGIEYGPSRLGNFSHWAVSTPARQCAPVASNIYSKGGNIADAAVATLLCMGVVLPKAMGIGGGFVATFYSRKEQEALSLISREVAPTAARRDMFVGNATLSVKGGLAIAVPGEVRGYAEIHRRLKGRLPWHALFQDAIRLARDGFPVSKLIAYSLCYEARDLFSCPDGPCDPTWEPFWNRKAKRPLIAGERLVQKDLAKTLAEIAKHGPNYFYEGKLAEQMVQEIAKHGGILTLDDLRSYKPTWTRPVSVTFRDGRVAYSAPPPAGGAIYSYIMAIMDAFRSNDSAALQDDVLTLHRFVEACKFAYAKRALLGDPRFVNVADLVQNLTSRDNAESTRRQIDDERTYHDPAHYGFVGQIMPSSKGTAHLAMWKDGDALSVTSSINSYFGSHVRSSSGIVFNNHMDDFSIPGESNYWGVAPSKANFIEPGKRPQSSMSPSIVLDPNGDVELVVGGSGGPKITTGAALVSMRSLWMGSNIKDAIDYARVHDQLIPDYIMAEPAFPEMYSLLLKAKGHNIQTVATEEFSNVQGVLRKSGRLYANSDYRSGGDVYGG
ncbi:scoloptoxin SSD14-like [Haemaphysalis longicornis]